MKIWRCISCAPDGAKIAFETQSSSVNIPHDLFQLFQFACVIVLLIFVCLRNVEQRGTRIVKYEGS